MIPIRAANGGFRWRITDDGTLLVATIRNRMLYRFGRDGQLISSESAEWAFFELAETPGPAVDGSTGVRYVLRGLSILAVEPDRSMRILVKHPWWPWYFSFSATMPFFFVSWGSVMMLFAAFLGTATRGRGTNGTR